MFSDYVARFLFILIRTSIFVSLLPIIGSKQFPMQFRLGMAVFMALLLTPVVKFEIAENQIPMLILRELFMGIALGITVRFIFMAVNMAGQFISHTMGMSIATTFNPEMGQSTHIAEAYGIIAMLFFLVMDAHHDLIYVFVKSFEVLPAGRANILPIIPEILSLVLPLNIFLGFLLMIMSIPVFEYVININFSNLRDEMIRLIVMAKG
jgi:flagellar biosynthetic protein FliR